MLWRIYVRAKAPSRRPMRKTSSSEGPTIRSTTKQARAIEMLRSKDGVPISALMGATGRQQHSVRGFLVRVVRKRLKLYPGSEVNAGVRIYRILRRSATPPLLACGPYSLTSYRLMVTTPTMASYMGK